ncbi:glycosyltransferase [Blastopirellula marina]|nr:glycosyltransferase [Blastopirellula marina]
MIFVTVGNLDPFDRLIQAVDHWVSQQDSPVEVLAQIGTGSFRPAHCQFVDFLSPAAYREAFDQSKLVISHAGMGSIITALEKHKPMIIMPKRATLGEQRNEHQLATATRFRRSPLIQVAEDEKELLERLSGFNLEAGHNSELEKHVWPPDASLVDFVRKFVSPEPAKSVATPSAVVTQ